MAELQISETGWSVTGHPGTIVLHLPNPDGPDLPVRVTTDVATELGLRLIQSAAIADTSACTQRGSVDRIDRVLDEYDRAPGACLGVID